MSLELQNLRNLKKCGSLSDQSYLFWGEVEGGLGFVRATTI